MYGLKRNILSYEVSKTIIIFVKFILNLSISKKNQVHVAKIKEASANNIFSY